MCHVGRLASMSAIFSQNQLDELIWRNVKKLMTQLTQLNWQKCNWYRTFWTIFPCLMKMESSTLFFICPALLIVTKNLNRRLFPSSVKRARWCKAEPRAIVEAVPRVQMALGCKWRSWVVVRGWWEDKGLWANGVFQRTTNWSFRSCELVQWCKGASITYGWKVIEYSTNDLENVFLKIDVYIANKNKRMKSVSLPMKLFRRKLLSIMEIFFSD